MKKFYYHLFFVLLLCSSAQAQVTLTCGDSGTTITINDFAITVVGSNTTRIDYDFTIIATEVGNYQLKVSNLPSLSIPVAATGIVSSSGSVQINLPAVMITMAPSIRLITPSGDVCLLDVSSLLPVTFTAFTVDQEDDGRAFLRWSTATELNNEGFYIEHARNGEDWQSLGFVGGVGTTNEPQHYEYIAEDLPAGDHYFRLRQVDHDGSFSFSSVNTLYMEGREGPLRIFPNPVRRGQQLNIKGGFDQIEIYNLTGRRVMELQDTGDLGASQFTDLPAGLYHLRIQRHGKMVTEKLVIQ